MRYVAVWFLLKDSILRENETDEVGHIFQFILIIIELLKYIILTEYIYIFIEFIKKNTIIVFQDAT